jgi:soluble lytic murein transglycosylase-like protein
LKYLALLSVFVLTTCATLDRTYQSGTNYIYHEPIPMREPVAVVNVPIEYQAYLHEICTKYEVPYQLMARLIERESNWNHRAVGVNPNGTKDYGISQLNSAYYLDFAWRFGYTKFNPFEPFTSLELATRLVRHLYVATGDWYLAVCAYNAGLSRVRYGAIPETTKRYGEYIVGGDI